MKSWFETIGYGLGKTAANAKSLFDLLGGEAEESVRAEIRLGHDLAAAALERIPLVAANASTSYAGEIGRWLAGNLKEKRMPFTFRFTAERAPNGFALPGGHVFVSWPLLELCQGQRDEIAFVLAHEMAHITLRHTLDRTVRDSVLTLLLHQSSGRHAATAWLAKVGQQALSQGYARDEELEADAFAQSLIRTCGGDIASGERLLEKFARRRPDPGVPEWADYLASHPPPVERISRLRSRRLAWSNALPQSSADRGALGAPSEPKAGAARKAETVRDGGPTSQNAGSSP